MSKSINLTKDMLPTAAESSALWHSIQDSELMVSAGLRDGLIDKEQAAAEREGIRAAKRAVIKINRLRKAFRQPRLIEGPDHAADR